jgi:four helix bundle protein
MSFRFLKFKVYQDAKNFYKDIQNMIKQLPQEEKFALGDQLRRSSLSIVLNIAEGSDRGSDKDFARFLKNALGSLNETVAGIDIAYSNKYIEKTLCGQLLRSADSLSKQLAAFGLKLLKIVRS